MTLITPLDGLLPPLKTSHSDGDSELQVLSDVGFGMGGTPPKLPFDGVVVEMGSVGSKRSPEDDVPPVELFIELEI